MPIFKPKQAAQKDDFDDFLDDVGGIPSSNQNKFVYNIPTAKK